MAESTVRQRFDYSLSVAEMAIYSALAVLLSLTILAALASACKLLLDSLIHWTVATQTLRVLNELLIVLMLAEILHTVRISIRSHVLVTEPFLVVGLIASIRRILVISLEMATPKPSPACGNGSRQRRSCCDCRFRNADNRSSSLAKTEVASSLPLSCFSRFEMSVFKAAYSGSRPA